MDDMYFHFSHMIEVAWKPGGGWLGTATAENNTINSGVMTSDRSIDNIYFPFPHIESW